MNKNLRLDTVQVYGFDYDYTLAHYSPDLQTLIYDLAKEHMVHEVIFIYFIFFVPDKLVNVLVLSFLV